MSARKLAKDWYGTLVHGITRRDLEEGTYCAGTRIRKLRGQADVDPATGNECTIYHAQVSSDGRRWYHVRSWEAPILA